MSLYILDTHIVTLFRASEPNIVRRIHETDLDQIAVTVISVEEQLDGWYRLLRRKNSPDQLSQIYDQIKTTVDILSLFNLLSFSVAAIQRYEQLQTLRLNIGKMDLRIAAIALELRAVVVTQNLRDFERVPDLVVENWAAS
ncbi:MAG: hypothetical protein OHK0029_17060 [Armatimonadaceae bacterium]